MKLFNKPSALLLLTLSIMSWGACSTDDQAIVPCSDVNSVQDAYGEYDGVMLVSQNDTTTRWQVGTSVQSGNISITSFPVEPLLYSAGVSDKNINSVVEQIGTQVYNASYMGAITSDGTAVSMLISPSDMTLYYVEDEMGHYLTASFAKSTSGRYEGGDKTFGFSLVVESLMLDNKTVDDFVQTSFVFPPTHRAAAATIADVEGAYAGELLVNFNNNDNRYALPVTVRNGTVSFKSFPITEFAEIIAEYDIAVTEEIVEAAGNVSYSVNYRATMASDNKSIALDLYNAEPLVFTCGERNFKVEMTFGEGAVYSIAEKTLEINFYATELYEVFEADTQPYGLSESPVVYQYTSTEKQ